MMKSKKSHSMNTQGRLYESTEEYGQMIVCLHLKVYIYTSYQLSALFMLFSATGASILM